MYRQYEDPRKLEKMLEDAERRLSDAQAAGFEGIESLYEEVAELRERVNFAWQDEEWEEFQTWVEANNGIPADPELPFN